MKTNEQTNKKPSTILYLFLWSSAYFTVISLVLLILQVIQADNRYIEPSRFLLIYPFGVMMALGNLTLKCKGMKPALKTALHYLITVASFYVFLIMPAAGSMNPFFLIVLLSVIYFAIAAPILIVNHIKRKKAEEATPYTSVYKKSR